MKIAYIVTQYPPAVTAGLGRYVERITPYLARRHRLAVFTLNDGSLPEHERDGAVTVHRPRTLLASAGRGRRLNRTRRHEFLLLTAHVVMSNWRYFLRLRRTSRDERPDLVAVHDSTNFLSALLCHYVLRLPIVYHVHTTEYGVAPQRTIIDPLNVFAAVERHLGRIARRVVVPTPDVREQLVAAGWTGTAIDVVCLGGTFEAVLADPGFDRDKLRARAADRRALLGIPAAAPVLLFVGRLERQKGIYQLLEAMREIAPAVPGLRLVAVGEGDIEGVRRIVAGAGLDGDVLASGEFVEASELLEYYEMADACVFPSLYEPFGLVATESMAMARATILGDGFSQIFLGDPASPSAEFVRADDPQDIAAAVIGVLTDPARRRALAEQGERLVRERLSWARAAEETLAVYRDAARTSRKEEL
ncbi:glycosyltransferase family 4 protein [Spirillospora sp. NPDC048911]|uniref:glycosyltransferase family 4 protein n=1 Tax=Spirillospora sp. NPDC048911 TaxID=3364527 RepID=UPI00371983DD